MFIRNKADNEHNESFAVASITSTIQDALCAYFLLEESDMESVH